METDLKKIFLDVESMQIGASARLEAKLKNRNGRLCGMLQVNENINIGSSLYQKGPLYWNAIYVEENGKKMMYRISEYLDL